MFTVIQSPEFKKWLKRLRDRQATMMVGDRLLRIEDGHLGDVRSVGDGVSEARIHYGPGYRLYFIQREKVMIVMLAGGDKSGQQRDIQKAKRLAKQWRGWHEIT